MVHFLVWYGSRYYLNLDNRVVRVYIPLRMWTLFVALGDSRHKAQIRVNKNKLVCSLGIQFVSLCTMDVLISAPDPLNRGANNWLR